MTTPTLTSAVPQVTDYLYTTATALLPAVTVFDGPNPTADSMAAASHLWIGWNPQAAEATGAAADQDFAFLDYARTRDERGTITCAAENWSGSTVVKIQRDATAAIVAQVELMLRGTPGTGGPGDASMGGLCMWSQVTGPYEWYPRQNDDGSAVLCVFTVSYYARLTTGS